jgi:hypothetical protein
LTKVARAKICHATIDIYFVKEKHTHPGYQSYSAVLPPYCLAVRFSNISTIRFRETMQSSIFEARIKVLSISIETDSSANNRSTHSGVGTGRNGVAYSCQLQTSLKKISIVRVSGFSQPQSYQEKEKSVR